MQSEDLELKTQQYARKYPFLKGLIISELKDDVEIYKYIASDLQFKQETNDNFLNGLRGGMNELYNDFKGQFNKLGECKNFEISVMYDQYFVRKVQICDSLLLIVICETARLDMGSLGLMCADYEANFNKIKDVINKISHPQQMSK